MNRRWIQNLCIIAVFLLAFVAVTAVGIGQGIEERSVSETGTDLSKKLPWEQAIETDPLAEALPHLQDSDIVYTTPTGQKYHLYSDCTSLSRSKQVIGQSFADVKESGKELCSLCKNRYGKKQ